MKHLTKSISSLNNYNFSIKANNLNKGFKSPNPSINIKKNKKFLLSMNLDTKKFTYTNRKNNSEGTLNIKLLKSPINNLLTLRKSRNKIKRYLLKNISNIGLLEKNKPDNIEKEAVNNNKDNYLLLTSLYNLPKIKKPVKLNKKPYSYSHFGDTSKNEFYTGQNNSTINDKSIFNESMTSSNDKSTFNYINLLYNTNESKTSQRKNMLKKKKRLLSALSSLLKNKYYSDTEEMLKRKINIQSFPRDHSLKDKIIHLKKFGAFWDSVFNYCVPIISVKKYKAQRDFSERKKLDYLKLIKNKSNYYNMAKGQNIINIQKKIDKSISQPIFYTSRIIK